MTGDESGSGGCGSGVTIMRRSGNVNRSKKAPPPLMRSLPLVSTSRSRNGYNRGIGMRWMNAHQPVEPIMGEAVQVEMVRSGSLLSDDGERSVV